MGTQIITNSPIPNCRLLLEDNKKIYLITNHIKAKKLIKEKKINKNQIIEPDYFETFINKLSKKKIMIDHLSCSLFYENLLKKKFKISKRKDPIYLLKSIKNKIEIQNMINSHILDGVALTKFLYWIKKVNKKR